jgi:hypothetical protein
VSQRFFVHVYRVVRSKFLIEAENPAAAMEAADAVLYDANNRLAYEYFGAASIEEEKQRIDGLTAPFHLATEDAEETTGYLVDYVGDEDYDRSQYYFGDGSPDDCSRHEKLMLNPRERDTILAALRLWQHAQEGSVSLYNKDCDTLSELENEIACGDHGNPLTADEIDTLCERVNT